MGVEIGPQGDSQMSVEDESPRDGSGDDGEISGLISCGRYEGARTYSDGSSDKTLTAYSGDECDWCDHSGY